MKQRSTGLFSSMKLERGVRMIPRFQLRRQSRHLGGGAAGWTVVVYGGRSWKPVSILRPLKKEG